jgi:hypothetical protein
VSEQGFTLGPWVPHPRFPREIVPEGHSARSVGGSVDHDENRDRFAQVICHVQIDRHGRGDMLANARLIAASPDLYEALKAVREFVEAEVDNRGAAGSDMSDYQNEAQQTLDLIDAALSKARGE